MVKQQLILIIILTGIIAFFSCSNRNAPTDSEGRLLIVKLGTVAYSQVKTDPVVFKNKVYRFEFLKSSYQNNNAGNTCFRYVEHETGKTSKSFAKGYYFGSAYVLNDTAYVTAVEINGGKQVHIFTSVDYSTDRYTAPHFLRYLDGYYYNFYLEAHEDYEQRVVRSRDFVHWEYSPLNPVLKASSEDKQIANENLPEELKQKIAEAPDINNSDISFCEYKGKLIINYAWGNQQDVAYFAEAYYDGTTEQFLRGWFPDKKTEK